MEPYRFTLATTAVAVLGLVAAAHFLHTGNFEDLPRSVRPVVAQTAATAAPAAAWIDPPFDLYLRPSATASEMAVLAPRMTAPLPAGMTMVLTLSAGPAMPAGTTAAADHPPKAEVVRRRKAVQRAVRVGRAAAARNRTATAAPTLGHPLDGPSLDLSLEGEG